MLTLSKDLFTKFIYVSMLRLRNCESSQKQEKFAEIVAITECSLIITDLQNKESRKQPFRKNLPVKLVDGRMSVKEGKVFSYLI